MIHLRGQVDEVTIMSLARVDGWELYPLCLPSSFYDVDRKDGSRLLDSAESRLFSGHDDVEVWVFGSSAPGVCFPPQQRGMDANINIGGSGGFSRGKLKWVSSRWLLSIVAENTWSMTSIRETQARNLSHSRSLLIAKTILL